MQHIIVFLVMAIFCTGVSLAQSKDEAQSRSNKEETPTAVVKVDNGRKVTVVGKAVHSPFQKGAATTSQATREVPATATKAIKGQEPQPHATKGEGARLRPLTKDQKSQRKAEGEER